MKSLISLVVAAVGLSACMAKRQSSLTEATVLGAPDCREGFIHQPFMLTALTTLPAPEDVGLSSTSAESPFDLVTATANVRLDVCFDDSEQEPPQLTQVTLLSSAFDLPKVFVVGSDAVVEGLAAAIFGDPVGLKIQVPFPTSSIPPQNAAIEIRGWQTAQGKVVTAGRYYRAADATTPRKLSGYALIGTLTSGDPFPSGECSFGENLHTSSVAVPDVKIELKTCQFQGTGETTDYRVKTIEIWDATPGLSADAAHVFLAGDQIRTRNEHGVANCDDGVPACASVRHHNWCDALVVRMPNVVYAATSGSIQVCDANQILPGAPQTASNPEGGIAKSVFAITRGEVVTRYEFDGHLAFFPSL